MHRIDVPGSTELQASVYSVYLTAPQCATIYSKQVKVSGAHLRTSSLSQSSIMSGTLQGPLK